MDTDMLNRIVKGIDFLNAKFGSLESWINKIDLDKLAMYSVYNCIVGQIFGSYDFTMWPESESPGVCSGHPYGFDDKNDRYDELTYAWTVVLSGLHTTL